MKSTESKVLVSIRKNLKKKKEITESKVLVSTRKNIKKKAK